MKYCLDGFRFLRLNGMNLRFCAPLWRLQRINIMRWDDFGLSHNIETIFALFYPIRNNNSGVR